MAGSVHTNRFRKNLLTTFFRNDATLYLVLCTEANVPTEDTNTLSDLIEVAAGAGYTSGGIALTANATDFPTITEDDTNDEAVVTMRDISFVASGGELPLSGAGAAFAVLTGSGGTVSAREVLSTWDIRNAGGARRVSDTQSLLLQGLKLRIKKPA